MTENPPSPAMEEKRNGLPAPVRVILKLVMYIGLIAVLFWCAMSLVLNYYLKDSFEMYLTGVLHQETRIKGGISLGRDLAKPSMAFHDIEVKKNPQFPSSMTFELEKFEAGLPWQTVKEGQEKLLSFFVKVENLRADGKAYGSFEFPVQPLPNNDFEIHGLKGELRDARLLGDVLKRGNKLEVTADVTGVDYGDIVQGANGGKMKAEIRLAADAKDDTQAILPYLGGTVYIEGGAGVMAGNSVGFWAGDVVKNVTQQKQETDIKCVVGDFIVENGIARPRAFVIDTDEVTIYGSGYIDFLRQYADMVFTPRPKQSSMLNLAVPIVIAGPFNRLAATPDPAAVAARLAAMAAGLPSSVMQPLPAPGVGENACVTYVKGAVTEKPVTPEVTP